MQILIVLHSDFLNNLCYQILSAFCSAFSMPSFVFQQGTSFLYFCNELWIEFLNIISNSSNQLFWNCNDSGWSLKSELTMWIHPLVSINKIIVCFVLFRHPTSAGWSQHWLHCLWCTGRWWSTCSIFIHERYSLD